MPFIGKWTVDEEEIAKNDALWESGNHPDSIRSLMRLGHYREGQWVNAPLPQNPTQPTLIVTREGHIARVPFHVTANLAAKGARLATQADLDARAGVDPREERKRIAREKHERILEAKRRK
jgi:hypothetical protein